MSYNLAPGTGMPGYSGGGAPGQPGGALPSLHGGFIKAAPTLILSLWLSLLKRIRSPVISNRAFTCYWKFCYNVLNLTICKVKKGDKYESSRLSS